MHFKRFIASAAVSAALVSLPVMANAAEPYVIKPSFPDNFKMKITVVSDDVEDTMGEVKKTHLDMGASAELNRSGDGYKGTYRIETFDMKIVGADGKSQISAMETAMASSLIKSIGVAKVTMNSNLEPVSVDNIEDIKASMKSLLTAGSDGDEGTLLYNMLIANQTPETAANLIRQSNKAVSFYNIPLTLGQPVELPPATLDFLGSTLKTRTTMTLKSWEAGKTARLSYVMNPTEEDLNAFMSVMMKGMASQLSQGEEAENVEIMNRIADNMTMTMVEDCEIDVDLVNPINYTSTCDTDIVMSIDLLKIMQVESPPEGTPAVMSFKQSSHKVSDTRVVP
ncbi:hypothetical protein ABAC460_21625 [Asticcacaulis sp. AC460]|uniref:hypothetical protein n=1 Tax=Asticcacaulis sp. AC460 TaxID=1282360 RepID=UPI0003C3F1DC|nr:hypothetical protein [Asticcacaulis sp. AC460]ESQ86983.1 hypothetical protein ABAC460_21625 [Asticcacaulis sp. AC460]